MANLIDSSKYLDLTGLGIYDSLIKGVITAGDQANADNIDTLATTVTNELTELDERVDNNTSGISSLNTRVASLETSTSDWNENDSTSPSYIKNRTHYEETSERTLYTGNKAPVDRDNYGGIFFDIPLDSLMQSGEEIEMKITPRGADSTVLRGTAGNNGRVVLKTSYYPSGPAAILYNEYIHGALDFNLTLSGINIPQDANFEIKAVNTTVHVLNEKFIPATIARTADLGVLKTGGVTYNSGTNQFGYGGTSGGGYVNRINLNSGYITGLTGIYSLFGAPITISGNVTGIGNITLNSGTISGVTGISGVSTISGQNGRINFSSGTLTGIYGITFANGVTLRSGAGASVTGTGAIWANNFGVSGDLLFSGNSSVQKRFGSGALPVVTFSQTIDSSREYTDIMSLGKGKALSIVDYYNENSPLQPSKTPEVNVSGNLNVSGTIYAGNSYNTISGNSGGLDIRTTSGHSVAINGVNVNSSGSISEVAMLEFKSGGTLAPSIIGVQEIFGKNNVHISMSGSTSGDGVDFGNAPLKNVNGITMYSGGKITGADLAGNGNNISGYSNITMRSSGYLEMIDGTLNVSGSKINAQGVTLNATGATINGAYLSGVYIRGGYLYDNTQMGSVDISGSINAPYQTLTINRITGVSGGINMDGGSISGASSISGAGGAVNIGFSGAGISGKLDMISGILETSGVEIRSGGTVSINSGILYADGCTLSMLGAEIDLAGASIGGSIDGSTAYINGIEMEDVTITGVNIDGGTIQLATINGATIDGGDITGNIEASGATIYHATIEGTIQNTTFNSGNTFTTGFVDELKTALGIS